MTEHKKIKIFGKVQGVYFRASAKEIAQQLNIKGFVRNEPDTSIYIEAEGNDEATEKLINWCRLGPPKAKVEDVKVEKGQLQNYKDFDIYY